MTTNRKKKKEIEMSNDDQFKSLVEFFDENYEGGDADEALFRKAAEKFDIDVDRFIREQGFGENYSNAFFVSSGKKHIERYKEDEDLQEQETTAWLGRDRVNVVSTRSRDYRDGEEMKTRHYPVSMHYDVCGNNPSSRYNEIEKELDAFAENIYNQ